MFHLPPEFLQGACLALDLLTLPGASGVGNRPGLGHRSVLKPRLQKPIFRSVLFFVSLYPGNRDVLGVGKKMGRGGKGTREGGV